MKYMKKKVIPMLFVLVLCLSMGTPAFASTPDENSTNVLVEKIVLSADECKEIYKTYVACYGDYTDITTALADSLSAGGFYTFSVATSIASALGAINYTVAMDAAYKGWQSGRGATVYVYDSGVPVIIAN